MVTGVTITGVTIQRIMDPMGIILIDFAIVIINSKFIERISKSKRAPTYSRVQPGIRVNYFVTERERDRETRQEIQRERQRERQRETDRQTD